MGFLNHPRILPYNSWPYALYLTTLKWWKKLKSLNVSWTTVLVVATLCCSRWWLSAPLYSTLLHTHWKTQKLISTVCFCRRTPPIYSKISHPQNNPFQSKVFVVFIIFSFFFKKKSPLLKFTHFHASSTKCRRMQYN